MALFTKRLEVNGTLATGKKYKVNNFETFKVEGKYGRHNTAIVETAEGVIAYLPQTGADALAWNLDEARAAIETGLYVTLRPAHSRKFNSDFIACDFSNE